MGNMYSVMAVMFPPKAKYDTDRDIPDLTGRVALVTGGYSGIGYCTAKELLKKNAKVYIAGRSRAKGDEAIENLKKETDGKTAIFIELDLSSLKSVKDAAADFNSKETELHILFNNAGVMFPPVDELTADGYDQQWGTNVLGHFYFTKLLLPALISAAKASPDAKARVVNTSSAFHWLGDVDFATFRDSPKRKKLGTQKLYMQSKVGNILFSNQLAKRYGDQGIVSTSLHPGSIATPLTRHMSAFERKISAWTQYEPHFGALTQLWAGTSPETVDHNGKFLIPWARVGTPLAKTNDEKLAEEVWEWCEEQVKDL
jgi:retinol dehydrogenase-12